LEIHLLKIGRRIISTWWVASSFHLVLAVRENFEACFSTSKKQKMIPQEIRKVDARTRACTEITSPEFIMDLGLMCIPVKEFWNRAWSCKTKTLIYSRWIFQIV
jgi:hypothetical protein